MVDAVSMPIEDSRIRFRGRPEIEVSIRASVHRRSGSIVLTSRGLLLGSNGCLSGCNGSEGIRHDPGRVELGRDSSGKVSVLSLHVSPDRVVSGEGSWAVWAGHSNALMALPDVGT